MKNISRTKLIRIAAAMGVGVSFGLGSFVIAADLSWTADTNISIGGNIYKIVSNSTPAATTLAVSDTTITVSVPSGSFLAIRSADRYLLTNSLTLTQSCTSTDNTLEIVGPISNLVITPNATTTCTVLSGGSGGGGVSPTPAPTPTPPSANSGHPSGTLIIDNGTVYLIKDGTRYGFRDSQEYLSHGYNFGQAVAANAQDRAMPQSLFVLKALEGTLVLDAADNTTVYMIGLNGTKRGFVNASVFTALGYNFANLPKINLSDYPPGAPIGDATLPHPEGALVLDGQTVWWILGGQKQGFESMAVFNTYGFSLTKLVKANAADLALTTGPVVKFRDGTLVYDGSSYFLISKGKKLMFTSAADLTARGYKTSNAINASLAAYVSDGNVQ
jgi:hypothetical protein